MKKLYMVKTENRFNQLKIFDKYGEAYTWLLKATGWDNEKIKNSITTLEKNRLGAFDIFPNYEKGELK